MIALGILIAPLCRGDVRTWTNKSGKTLRGLKAGKRGDAIFAPLLAGRSWEELEEDIHRMWRSRGVRINFR